MHSWRKSVFLHVTNARNYVIGHNCPNTAMSKKRKVESTERSSLSEGGALVNCNILIAIMNGTFIKDTNKQNQWKPIQYF